MDIYTAGADCAQGPPIGMYSIKYYYIRGSTNWYRQPVALEGTSKQVTGNKEKTKGVTGNW